MVREVVKATGDIITVAGTGIAGDTGDGRNRSRTEHTAHVAIDSEGDLFIEDSINNRIYEVAPR